MTVELISITEIQHRIDALKGKRTETARATRAFYESVLTVRTGADRMDNSMSRWLILSAIATDGDILADNDVNRGYVAERIQQATGLTAKSGASVKVQASWVRTLARDIVKGAEISGSIDSADALRELLARIDAGTSLATLYKARQSANKSDEGANKARQSANKSDEGANKSDEGANKSDEGANKSDEGANKSDEGANKAGRKGADSDKLTLSMLNAATELVEWLKGDDKNVLTNTDVKRLDLIRKAINRAAEVHNNHRAARA